MQRNIIPPPDSPEYPRVLHRLMEETCQYVEAVYGILIRGTDRSTLRQFIELELLQFIPSDSAGGPGILELACGFIRFRSGVDCVLLERQGVTMQQIRQIVGKAFQ